MIRKDELEGSPQVSRWTEVKVVGDGAAFAQLRGEWEALLGRSQAGIFNSWDWLYPWYRRIGPDRKLMILTARNREGRLVGLMPLCVEEKSVLGRPVRRLSFLGENHVGADYLDLIAETGQEEELARTFVAALRERGREWDLIDLVDLASDSVTVKIFSEAFAPWGAKVEQTDRWDCPYERFAPGEQWDAFLRRTGRRDNYLRRKKWLEKQPGYRIEKTEAAGELARPMSEFFRLHALRWQGDGGSSGIKGSGVEAFHRDATGYLAENGRARLYTMWVGEQAVASVYGIVHRGSFIYFQAGYDPEWRSKSVGLVLVGETFKDALEQGLTEYDFLRGTETYKSDWTTQLRKTVALRIVPVGGRGALLDRYENFARQTRNLGKRLLPGQWVERIRRARRKTLAVATT